MSSTFKLFEGGCSLRGFNPFAFWIRDLNHQNVLIQPLTGRGLILQWAAYFQNDSAFTLEKKDTGSFMSHLIQLKLIFSHLKCQSKIQHKASCILFTGPLAWTFDALSRLQSRPSICISRCWRLELYWVEKAPESCFCSYFLTSQCMKHERSFWARTYCPAEKEMVPFQDWIKASWSLSDQIAFCS